MATLEQITAKLEAVASANGLSPEELAQNIADQFELNQRLYDCEERFIRLAITRAIRLGLDLSPAADEAYLAPRKTRVALVPGYRGLLKLAYRNPRVAAIESHCVYQDDSFTLDLGANPPIKHIINPQRGPESQPIGAYAVLWWKDFSRPMVEWMTKAEIDANAERGGTTNKDTSAWTTDWPQMARKTVIKRLLKYLIKLDGPTPKTHAATPDLAPHHSIATESTSSERGDDATLAAEYAKAIEEADQAMIDLIIRAIREENRLDSIEKTDLYNRAVAKKREFRRKGLP